MTREDYSLGGLFLSAFVSSTVLPGGSEVLLAALLTRQTHESLTLLAVATAGNTLGGMTTWWLGLLISRRFPLSSLKKSDQVRAVQQLKAWGSPILLLSWVPFIGDPLCLAAGWATSKRFPGLLLDRARESPAISGDHDGYPIRINDYASMQCYPYLGVLRHDIANSRRSLIPNTSILYEFPRL